MVENSFTGKFINRTMGKLKKGITSIIKMAMEPIMRLATLNQCMEASTFPCIKSGTKETHYGCWNHKGNGPHQMQAENSLVNQEKQTGNLCLQKRNLSAKSVENSLLQRIQAQTDFVQISANLHGEGKAALMMFIEYAGNAAKNSQSTNTLKCDSVRVSAGVKVLDVQKSGKSDVWCMTVPETKSFVLSNGSVVHNSRYAVMSTRHAYTEPVAKRQSFKVVGARNW